MDQIFVQLAIILFTAFIISYIAKLLKQPLIMGYIVAGVIISPFLILFGATKEVIDIFSKFGIAFLLFIVGLHMNPKIIREVGMHAFLIGIGQMALTFLAGFLVAWKVLGLSFISSSYIGIAIAFSSTIIVMKLLSDRQDLDSLYGKITIGVLIVQDVIAMGVLLFISSLSGGANLQEGAIRMIALGLILVVLLFLGGYFILPKFTKFIARSQELLFLFSICWCFLISALFDFFGMSIEIGALIAGITLSLTPYSTEISSKVRPLRDFFLIIFFIILGLNIPLEGIGSIIFNAIILSLVVVLIKPIIVMYIMKLIKYTKRTNFLVGISLAQVSEFSLIILGLGVSLGHIESSVFQTLILTMVLTIMISSYMIIYSRGFYSRMERFASLFERKDLKKKKIVDKNYDAILFGYNRIGYSILNSMNSAKKRTLVVDFNPDVISTLNKFKVPCIYGDVDDPQLLNELPISKIDIAVSTIPEYDSNVILVEGVRAANPDAIVIARAHNIQDALELYNLGADYVILPHFLGGEYTAELIEKAKENKTFYKREKEKQLKSLKERLDEGHEHP